MPSPTPLNGSSLVTRSERQRSPAVSEFYSPASWKTIFLLACLAAAASILSSCVSIDSGGSQPSPAPQLPSSALDGPESAQDDWLGRVQQGLAEAGVPGEPQPRGGLQAPNRAHNLRTYFEASGIRVHDRTAAGSRELLSLSLSSARAVPGRWCVGDARRGEERGRRG